jgi:hypothetical protein
MNQPIVRPQKQQRRVEGRSEMPFKRPAGHPMNKQPVPIQAQPAPQVVKRNAPNIIEESSTASPLPGVQIAVKSQTEQDSSYIDITLPSNFYFYPFKTLSVRPVRANEQAKFNRAAKEGKMKHLVDAVSSCLEGGRSAYELTPQDFHFVMYWLRMNSYGKTPMMHNAVCENKEHIDDVISKKKDIKTLNISVVITKTLLTEVVFDESKIYTPEAPLPNGLQLGYLTMRDVVDISELDEREDFEEIEWLADHAGFLAPRNAKEVSIMARIELLKALSPDDIEEITLYTNSISDYGIKEIVSVRCGDCGAETVSTITINALTFLPASRRAVAA